MGVLAPVSMILYTDNNTESALLCIEARAELGHLQYQSIVMVVCPYMGASVRLVLNLPDNMCMCFSISIISEYIVSYSLPL